MAQQSRVTYLCLLDDVRLLSEHVQLGPIAIRQFSEAELDELFYGRDDHPRTAEEMGELKTWALFPWATTELTLDNSDLRNAFPAVNASDLFWERWKFQMEGRLDSFGTQPFGSLLRALCLLKPSRGPVIPRVIALRPNGPIQTRSQISLRTLSAPATTFYESAEEEGPCMWEYELGATDVSLYEALVDQLARCLSAAPPHSERNNHLRVAVHYFQIGEHRLRPAAGGFSAIDPLLAYDAALEALLIREDEHGTEKKLIQRVTRIARERLPETRFGAGSKAVTRRATDEELQNFVKKMFWIRSKAAHGVRSPEELGHMIAFKPDELVTDARGNNIPGAPYGSMIMSGGTFPGFLLGVRELARLCIRYFCDRYDDGLGRDQVLEQIDAQTRT